MIANMRTRMYHGYLKSLTVLSLGLLLCGGALPAGARQNQPSDVQPDPQIKGQTQGQQDPQAQWQPNQPTLPQTLTLPAGTIVRVRVDEWISSDRNSVGDSF